MCFDKFMKDMKKHVKKMKFWDIAMLKWASAVIGIIIGAYISAFVKQYIVIFAAIAIVLTVILLYRFFKN